MGYWSTHPMGGDSPLDSEYTLKLHMYNNKEILEKLFQEKKYKEFFNLLLNGLDNKDMGFVIPYFLITIGLISSNPVFINEINELLGDGGLTERGYDADSHPNPNDSIINFKNILLNDPNHRILKKIEELNSNGRIYLELDKKLNL